MAKKVVTFGEIMLRLAPEGYYRFVQADTFGATYGGGEANVAVSLANYGFDAKFVTKLPKHGAALRHEPHEPEVRQKDVQKTWRSRRFRFQEFLPVHLIR